MFHVNRKQVVSFALLHNTLAEDKRKANSFKVVDYALELL